MMWNCKDLHNQVKLLLDHYQDLSITEEDEHHILLSGEILVYRSAYDFILRRQYDISIMIPKAGNELPAAIDSGNAISNTYPHRYSDGSLCLETNTYIQYRFINGLNLVEWMDEFVEPFFFSYEFYCRFGKFPFGERPHGLGGLINTYQELWREDNAIVTCKLLRYAAEENYRGHTLCPCGSGKKLRQCHGPALLIYMKDRRYIDILQNDFKHLRKELAKHEQSKTNIKQTERS